MDINKLLNEYALGEITKEQLDSILLEVGYTKVLRDLLARRAEQKKAEFAERLILAVLVPETIEGWQDRKSARGQ